MRPKFIIITPTYPSRGKKLASAIASVRSQLFTDFLHVVIGDGPTPEAEKTCAELNHPKLVYDQLPEACGNFGYVCRNLALEKYEGDRYLFLDDDNVLLPKCLETINENCENQAIAIHKVIFYNKWTTQWIILPNSMPPSRSSIDMLNFSVHADIARGCKFEKEHLHELDWFFIEQCLKKTNGQYKFIDEILAVYF